jgi:hypothetical protein
VGRIEDGVEDASSIHVDCVRDRGMTAIAEPGRGLPISRRIEHENYNVDD